MQIAGDTCKMVYGWYIRSTKISHAKPICALGYPEDPFQLTVPTK